MPKRTDIKSVMVIGSGPIVIGQAAEFDYSGTQACRVLREEGIRVILVNSNPATIMTDPEMADATYIEPIATPILEQIIAKERPDALLPTLGGQTALNAAMALAEGVKAAALMMSTGATFAQTAAQYGLNAALLACPITWIVMLVIALVAAIYAACSAIAKFTGIANSGFGVICGGINVVVQFFVNLGLTIANIALGIWNALGACAQNIGIAFSNVISGVQAWFYNLLSTALTVVAGICEALNKLPFVEFDYSGITNAASDYAAKAAEASGNIQDFVSIGDAFNEGMSTFDTWQDGWVGDAFNAGANWGDGGASGISDAVGGLFDMDLGAATDYGAGGLGTGGYGDFAMDDLLGNTGQTAANTGAAADALSTSTEELEYLRDIAERDAINRFTTAEVRIDMTGMTNRIEGGADLDGVISTLTDGFTEALLTAAEGVHA